MEVVRARTVSAQCRLPGGERDAWPTIPRDGPQWVIPGVVGERVTRPRVGRTPLRRRLRLDGRGRFSIPPKLPCGMEPPYFEPARVAVSLAPEIGRGRPPVPFSVRGAHDTHTVRDPNLREGRSAPRCEWRAAHARRGSKFETKSDVKTTQGRRLAKVACTLTASSAASHPHGG